MLREQLKIKFWYPGPDKSKKATYWLVHGDHIQANYAQIGHAKEEHTQVRHTHELASLDQPHMF